MSAADADRARLPQAPARPAGPLGFDWAVVEQIRPEIDEPDSRWPQVMAAIQVPTLVIELGESTLLPGMRGAKLARIRASLPS
jgi:3-oxoadipate enol-lactonase